MRRHRSIGRADGADDQGLGRLVDNRNAVVAIGRGEGAAGTAYAAVGRQQAVAGLRTGGEVRGEARRAAAALVGDGIDRDGVAVDPPARDYAVVDARVLCGNHRAVGGDQQFRRGARQQHHVTRPVDVAPCGERAGGLRRLLADEIDIGRRIALEAADGLGRGHREIHRRHLGAAGDRHLVVAIVVDARGGTGVGVKAVGIGDGARVEVHARVRGGDVDAVAGERGAGEQRHRDLVVDVDGCGGIGVGHRAGRHPLGSGAGCHGRDAGLHVDRIGAQLCAGADDGVGTGAAGLRAQRHHRVGAGTGTQSAGIDAGIGIHLGGAGRGHTDAVAGHKVGAAADIHAGRVVEGGRDITIGKGQQAASDARCAHRAVDDATRIDRQVMDRRQRGSADIHRPGAGDGEVGFGVSDRNQAAALVDRRRRCIAQRRAADGDVAGRQAGAIADAGCDRGRALGVGGGAAGTHDAAADTAGRGGDDAVAGGRARQRAGAADAAQQLRAAAAGLEVEHQFAAAGGRQVHAFAAQGAGAGEHATRHGGVDAAGRDDLRARRVKGELEAPARHLGHVVGSAVGEVAQALVDDLAQAERFTGIGRVGRTRQRNRRDRGGRHGRRGARIAGGAEGFCEGARELDFVGLGRVENDEIALAAGEADNRRAARGGIDHLVAGRKAMAGADIDVVVVVGWREGRLGVRAAHRHVDCGEGETHRRRRVISDRLAVDEAMPGQREGVPGDVAAGYAFGGGQHHIRVLQLDARGVDRQHLVDLAAGQPADCARIRIRLVADQVAALEVVRRAEGEHVGRGIDRGRLEGGAQLQRVVGGLDDAVGALVGEAADDAAALGVVGHGVAGEQAVGEREADGVAGQIDVAGRLERAIRARHRQRPVAGSQGDVAPRLDAGVGGHFRADRRIRPGSCVQASDRHRPD